MNIAKENVILARTDSVIGPSLIGPNSSLSFNTVERQQVVSFLMELIEIDGDVKEVEKNKWTRQGTKELRMWMGRQRNYGKRLVCLFKALVKAEESDEKDVSEEEEKSDEE